MSCCIFLFGLLQLDLVDFDAEFRIGETKVHAEGICRLDIFPLWMFRQRSVFSTSKGLEGAYELGVVFIYFRPLVSRESQYKLGVGNVLRVVAVLIYSYDSGFPSSLKSNKTTAWKALIESSFLP